MPTNSSTPYQAPMLDLQQRIDAKSARSKHERSTKEAKKRHKKKKHTLRSTKKARRKRERQRERSTKEHEGSAKDAIKHHEGGMKEARRKQEKRWTREQHEGSTGGRTKTARRKHEITTKGST